jgi:uncharacterized protein YbdZ (MbtH family)
MPAFAGAGRGLVMRYWVISLGLGALGFLAGRYSKQDSPAVLDRGARVERNSFVSVASQDWTEKAGNRPLPVAAGPLEQLKRWTTAPHTPKDEADITTGLEALAADNPAAAMEFALHETNLHLRERWRDAVLRGWARQNPGEAAQWVQGLKAGDRRAAMSAVFAGSASKPENALRLFREFSTADPLTGREYAPLLVAAFSDAGDFKAAVSFADGDETEDRSALLNASFYGWALHQPTEALKALAAIKDPASRKAAFQGLAMGWAEANPASFATYAMTLAPGPDRAQSIDETLPQWANRDALAASEWMVHQLVPNPDLDQGVSSVATLASLISQSPEVAVGWAESITDAQLRSQALRVISQQWAAQNPEAARRFIEATNNLTPDEKAALSSGLAGAGGK